MKLSRKYPIIAKDTKDLWKAELGVLIVLLLVIVVIGMLSGCGEKPGPCHVSLDADQCGGPK